MNIQRPCILCVVIVLLAAPLYAQKKKNDVATSREHKPIVWKRRVARLVDTRDTLDAKGYVHKKEYGDTVLAKLLIDAAKAGKFTLYADIEDILSNSPISENKRKDMFTETSPDIDTMYIVRGDSEYAYVPKRGINYQDFTKYRVLEDWVFDPFKRESKIQILGVALLRDFFGEDDHDYRGSMATFWLKWKDVQQLLNQFMENHPGNNLQRYLWDSRFMYPGLSIDSQSSSLLPTEKIWQRQAIRTIVLKDTLDWENNHLYNENEYWTIAESFYDSIKERRLFAYKDSTPVLKNILKFDSLGLKTQPDTIDGDDIATKILFHDLDWGWFNNYNLLEEWSFDPENGKINIHLLGIEPRFDIQDIDAERMKPVLYEHMFWVRYNDVIDILDHYDEYHPLNNLSTSLWRSYFKE